MMLYDYPATNQTGLLPGKIPINPLSSGSHLNFTESNPEKSANKIWQSIYHRISIWRRILLCKLGMHAKHAYRKPADGDSLSATLHQFG